MSLAILTRLDVLSILLSNYSRFRAVIVMVCSHPHHVKRSNESCHM